MSDGDRTRDRLDHNQELYQLSYAHREGGKSSGRGRRDETVRANAPGKTRTCDIWLRRPALYPTELRGLSGDYGRTLN